MHYVTCKPQSFTSPVFPFIPLGKKQVRGTDFNQNTSKSVDSCYSDRIVDLGKSLYSIDTAAVALLQYYSLLL